MFYKYFKGLCQAQYSKVLFPNNYIFILGLNAYLSDVSSGNFWIGKLSDIDLLPKKVKSWADGGRDPSKDCVVADSSDEYKWKSEACTSVASYLCEASGPTCPLGYTWVPNAGPRSKSCFKIGNGAESNENYLDEKFYNSITTAETSCMEDGTRLVSPENLVHRDWLIEWLETNQDLRFSGYSDSDTRIERYYLGIRPFEHSKTKEDSCTTCNFYDQAISPWQSAHMPDEDISPLVTPSVDYTKCLNYQTLNSNLEFTLKPRNCYEKTSTQIHSLCEYRECETISGKTCKFPFKYAGRSYDTCITFGMADGESFCATEVNSDNKLINSDICHTRCSVNNCPIGFHSHLNSCIRLSAHHSHDLASNVEEAEDICLSLGSRLYQPRSIKSLRSLHRKNKLVFEGSSYHIFGTSQGHLRIAVGVNISLEGSPTPFYRDGTKFPYELIQASDEWSWEPNYPISNDGNKTNIFIIKGDKFMNDVSEMTQSISYICEARPTSTIEYPITSCHFPFKRDIDDEWHHSCIYDKNSKVSYTFL